MSASTRITLAAALCSLTLACAVAPIFSSFVWLSYSFFTVLVVAGSMLVARLVRVPRGLVPLVGVLALVLWLTGVFGDGYQLLAVLPGQAAVQHGQELIAAARIDIQELAPPAPPREGLLLLLTAGVGLATLVIDTLSVTWRHPAVAGLPIVVVVSLTSAIADGGIGWLPFTLIAAGYLTLLVAEGHSRMLRWGRPFADQDEEQWQPQRFTGSPVGQAGRKIGLTALGIALVLPVAFPFVTGGSLSDLAGHGGIGDGGSGSNQQVINPITTLKGQLTRDKVEELLRVSTDDPDPFYLRLTTLSQYTVNSGWSQGSISAPPSAAVSRGLPAPDYADDVPLRTVHAKVQVTADDSSRFLPVYLSPTKVSVKGDWRYDQTNGTVFSSRTNARDTSYSLTSESLARSDALTSVLSQAPDSDSGNATGDDPSYLAAPSDPRIQAIVAQIEQGQSTTYEKSLALWRYFRGPDSKFTYSLSTKPGSSGSDLLDFLTNKQGYCEQYASAMAVMARYAGLPARVAIGFTQGVKKNGYWSITTADAHAWVEIYFAGIGWVPWDPTPLGADGHGTALPYATQTDPATGGAGAGGTTGGLTGAGSSGSGAGDGLNSKLQQLQDQDNRSTDTAGQVPDLTPPPAPAQPDRTGWWVGLAVVLIALLLLSPVGRLVQRRRRLSRAGGRDPALAARAAWAEVLATARDVRIGLDDTESPRATAARLARTAVLDQPVRAALGRVTAAYEQAEYAREAATVDSLGADVRTLHSALLADSDRLVRLRAQALPASTVSMLGSTLLRSADRALSAVESLGRRLVPRRPARGST